MTRAAVLNTNPSGMTPAWFDAALNRAICSGKVARRLGPGRYLVSSVTQPGLWYLTTQAECTCPAGIKIGRCCCRALVAFEEMMVAQAAATPQSAA